MKRVGRGLSVLAGLLCLCNVFLAAEHRNADPGEHIIAVVPLIGSGTPDDPIRPMFQPKPRDVQAALNRMAPA
jgi:hypothetical protein